VSAHLTKKIETQTHDLECCLICARYFTITRDLITAQKWYASLISREGERCGGYNKLNKQKFGG